MEPHNDRHTVYPKLCNRYIEAVAGQRAQAKHVFLVALEKAPRVQESFKDAVTVIDLHKCMPGWRTTK